MNRMLIILFASCSQLAFAQSTAPVEQQVETPEKASKVEGQIVKVGERNAYLYNYKRYNVGANLFGLVYDYVSVSGSAAFSENVVARIALSRSVSSELKANDFSVSLGLPIYFTKAHTGFFVEPGYDAHAHGYVALGYHWMWDSGFNMHLAAGPARKGVIGFFQVGYAFGDVLDR